MACFRYNKTENVIFSLKYRQRKVDLNATKKSLVFVTIRHRKKISSLRPAIVYENFIFTQEYAFVERCYFLTFSFEGKFRNYDISVKGKPTKTNENIIFSDLFTSCRKTTYIVTYCNNIRQTHKDVDSSPISYADMKILAQVNKIKNPTESEIEETKRKDSNSDFVLVSFPDYNQ